MSIRKVIPELGHFALILALCMALIQVFFPLIGSAQGRLGWVAVARPAALGQLIFVALSFGCLVLSFIVHDFSVLYVAQNSNRALPLAYRIAGAWGAHEGSLLLWSLMMAIWSVAVAVFSRGVTETMVARVLAIMGMISVGFLLFTLLTSNPFVRLIPSPADGRDLNPLLQDFGLIIHPPMLYMGYVGFSVAFAFGIAAMISGNIDAAWARWARPWTNFAWLFLTIGIALGSWWAYYELGWGGWWFWDPVENASFMPWLAGTALIHSLAATEKRGLFRSWTLLLSIFAFSLCLLGTFLVRSGVLVSVHAFANDPARGSFILWLMVLAIGGALALYAWRAPLIRSTGSFRPVSRETGLLLNNIFLSAATVAVFLGTLYPLILDALGLGKISVGPPYFNSVFVPLMMPLALFVGFGAASRWKRDTAKRLLGKLWPVFLLSIVAGLVLAFVDSHSWQAAIGLTLAVWVILSSLWGVADRLRHFRRSGARAASTLTGSFCGMTLAHIGVGVFIIGVTFVSAYGIEQDVKMAPGDEYGLGGYSFRFEGVQDEMGPNFSAKTGTFVVTSTANGEKITLRPEKRTYLLQTQPMTEAGIDPGVVRDLYVSLGESLGGDTWSARLQVKPFVRWIWAGAILMAIGAFVAASDRRLQISRTG